MSPGGTPEYVAFYGTLMSAYDTLERIGARSALRLLGPCRIEGRIFDMGEWPSLALGGGVVQGEVFEVLDRCVFQIIDPFEEHYPADHQSSLYLRVQVRLLAPDLDAWVYVANRMPEDAPRILSGAWSTHRPRGSRPS